MLTFFLPYRVREERNIESIRKLFRTMHKYFRTTPKEVLIKIDSDDEQAPKVLEEIIGRHTFNFDIKVFTFKRWEGRWSLHCVYNYLLNKINPQSKYIIVPNDDTYISKSVDIPANNNYLLMGDFYGEMTPERLKMDYRKDDWFTCQRGLICAYPIISSKLAQITGFGFQPNIDCYFALINLILFNKYGVNIAKHTDEFVVRKNIPRTDDYGEDFDIETRIHSSALPKNPMFFKLIEQAAKNVYLNMKVDGLVK